MAADLEQRIATLRDSAGLPFQAVACDRPSGAQMKGFPLIHLLDVMDAAGPEVASSWRATLPESVRPQTERKAITSVAWVPVELYFHGVSWLAKERHGGVRGAIGIGHATATRDIGAFFRVVLGFTSPATILKMSGRFWKSYFTHSSLLVVSSSAHGCVTEIHDWPLRDEASLHEMAGSVIAWMEASRAKDVRVTAFERTSASSFRFEAQWR